MSINDIYKLVSYLVDKYQGTYLSPDDFNMVVNMAQRQYLNYLTEDGSGHTGMHLGRKSGMLINAPVVETLSIFIKESTLTVTSQVATQPTDLYRIISMRTSNDLHVVRKITPDKLAEIIDDVIDPPTLIDPIYVDMGSNFKIYPNTVTSVKVSYVRVPADMKWAYTGALVYDSANSVQPEWNTKDLEDIIYRTIGIIGINLKDGDLQRSAQMIKQQGE
jgi:hypothetical protein